MNMNTKSYKTAAFCLFLFLLLLAGTSSASEIYDFNSGWMFLHSDQQITLKDYKEHKSIWAGAKAATTDIIWPFTGFDFDEEGYRPVNLPHDWAVEDGFYPEEDGEQGYRKRGWGYYRKRFFVPSTWKGKRVSLQFGGIATHSTIWVNQMLFRHNYSGYNTITMDITPTLMFGRDNLIAIEVNAALFEGWWYEGAGIYRDVKLIVSDPVHIATEAGISVSAEVKIDGWNVSGHVNLVNDSGKDESPMVDIDIIDPNGKTIETKRFLPTLPANQTVQVPFSVRIGSPKTWSPDTPLLYQLKATIKDGNRVFDEGKTNFGFRTFKFDFTNGFSMNGKPMKIKGVCNHQDHAGVGAAVPAAIEEFRIKKLKEMGANAYRCAHNPPSENILDLCDKYGLLVIDENRAFNASPETIENLRAHIRRDRNHPSVIAWSIFNEEPLQGEFRGQEIARALVNAVKAEDETRPILAAMNGGFFSNDSARNVLDIVGFNYQYDNIEKFHSQYPNIPILLTEGASAFETRGEITTDREKLICSSYDTDAASWGTTHRKDWETVLSHRFLAGTFVWTGFDYHGEPTPYNNKFPANSSYFGCMDLCGFPKTAFYIRQAQWLDKPVLYAVPHWNQDIKVGQELDVFCATNVEEVTFILNGKDLGTFKVDPVDMLTQKVPYDPGTLLLIGRKNGQEVIRMQLETTGKPVALKLIPDRTEIKGDGFDAIPVTVCAVDASGRIVPNANVPVEFEVSGLGRNIGVGNGDPTCTLSEKADSRPLFNGYAQLIVQSNPGKKGTIEITAKSEGLRSDSCSIKIVAATPLPVIDGFINREKAISGWRASNPSVEKPILLSEDSGEELKKQLLSVELGNALSLKPKDWVNYYTVFQLPPSITENGGSICFKNMTGKATIYINGEVIHEKKTVAAADVVVKLKKGLDKIEINVPMQPDSKGRLLLGDLVYVTPEKIKKTSDKK